jgi:hypothetical protein
MTTATLTAPKHGDHASHLQTLLGGVALALVVPAIALTGLAIPLPSVVYRLAVDLIERSGALAPRLGDAGLEQGSERVGAIELTIAELRSQAARPAATARVRHAVVTPHSRPSAAPLPGASGGSRPTAPAPDDRPTAPVPGGASPTPAVGHGLPTAGAPAAVVEPAATASAPLPAPTSQPAGSAPRPSPAPGDTSSQPPVEAGAVGEAVDGTVAAVDETVDTTVGAVSQTVDETVETVDTTVGTVSQTVDETVGTVETVVEQLPPLPAPSLPKLP